VTIVLSGEHRLLTRLEGADLLPIGERQCVIFTRRA